MYRITTVQNTINILYTVLCIIFTRKKYIYRVKGKHIWVSS